MDMASDCNRSPENTSPLGVFVLEKHRGGGCVSGQGKRKKRVQGGGGENQRVTAIDSLGGG